MDNPNFKNGIVGNGIKSRVFFPSVKQVDYDSRVFNEEELFINQYHKFKLNHLFQYTN